MTRLVLRGATVITMAPHRPDAEQVDITVEDDLIADIGMAPVAPDGRTVELSGRIVIGRIRRTASYGVFVSRAIPRMTDRLAT